MAGYSGTPLARKLGIRPNEHVLAINAPDNYEKLLEEIPEGALIRQSGVAEPAFIHLFVITRLELEKRLAKLRKELAQSGALWVSWPKKASRVRTDITEDVIREVALPLGFVDVKVCAVDEIWSGLKLVIRRENRTGS